MVTTKRRITRVPKTIILFGEDRNKIDILSQHLANIKLFLNPIII